jgi:anti-sigma factor RsiW
LNDKEWQLMACPDELTLDLWLAGALPSDEAAEVASHAATCAMCLEAQRAHTGLEAELQAALALDDAELAYASTLDIAANWRTAPAWSWLLLGGVVAGFVSWLVAGPVIGPLLGLGFDLAVGSVLLTAVLGFVFGFGQPLFELIQSPALGLAQPLLALLAVALLAWPRQLLSQRSTQS